MIHKHAMYFGDESYFTTLSVSYNVERRILGWEMNYEFGKYSEMSVRGLIDILSRNFPGVTEENHREPLLD